MKLSFYISSPFTVSSYHNSLLPNFLNLAGAVPLRIFQLAAPNQAVEDPWTTSRSTHQQVPEQELFLHSRCCMLVRSRS